MGQSSRVKRRKLRDGETARVDGVLVTVRFSRDKSRTVRVEIRPISEVIPDSGDNDVDSQPIAPE